MRGPPRAPPLRFRPGWGLKRAAVARPRYPLNGVHFRHGLPCRRPSRVKPSATIAVTQKARELKNAGRDVIGLGAGEPDFDTPDNIKKAAIDAIRRGETKYPPVSGIVPLREAIAKQVQAREQPRLQAGADHRRHRRQADPVQRLHGDAEPRRRGHHPQRRTGSAIRRWWRSAAARRSFAETTIDNGFKLTAAALEKVITPKTKWLLMNSPSNPPAPPTPRPS